MAAPAHSISAANPDFLKAINESDPERRAELIAGLYEQNQQQGRALSAARTALNAQQGQHDGELFAERQRRESCERQLAASQAQVQLLTDRLDRSIQEFTRLVELQKASQAENAALSRQVEQERAQKATLADALQRAVESDKQLQGQLRQLSEENRAILAELRNPPKSAIERFLTHPLMYNILDKLMPGLFYKPPPEFRNPSQK